MFEQWSNILDQMSSIQHVEEPYVQILRGKVCITFLLQLQFRQQRTKRQRDAYWSYKASGEWWFKQWWELADIMQRVPFWRQLQEEKDKQDNFKTSETNSSYYSQLYLAFEFIICYS